MLYKLLLMRKQTSFISVQTFLNSRLHFVVCVCVCHCLPEHMTLVLVLKPHFAVYFNVCVFIDIWATHRQMSEKINNQSLSSPITCSVWSVSCGVIHNNSTITVCVCILM